jgi:glycosyltransferase involved in cell wall biosynthesis
MPKVSIITPIYNVEKYIERCARSLFEQTEEDLEFIFVNDCTPDSSMTILNDVIKDYSSRKSQIKILENEMNLGVAETRLKGIMEASGEYIIHCDSDDWVDKDMYRMLYEKAKAEDLDIVWCDFYRTDGLTNKYDNQNTQREITDIFKDILTAKKMATLWNHLVKRSIVTEHKYVEPKTNFMEDVVLLVQYFYYSNKIGYVNRPLYYYYQNMESISNSDTKDKTIYQVAQMDINLQLIFAFIKENKLDKTLKNEIIFRKFFNKRWLLPIIKSPKDCSLWINEYKEINSRMFFNPNISIMDKITSLLVELRLYPILKWIR